jgi:hypothetical protein
MESDLKQVRGSLERSGLSPMESDSNSWLRHRLLIPEGLSTETNEEGFLYFSWDRVEYRLLPEADVTSCVWQYLDLNDADFDRMARYLSTWGLPYIPEGETYMEDWETWVGEAQEARSAIQLIAATELGELANDDVLLELRHWDGFDDNVIENSIRKGDRYDYPKILELQEQEHRRHWLQEREAGRGLDLQRRVISNFVNGIPDNDVWPWIEHLLFSADWDETGRHAIGGAYGIKAIVGWCIVRTLSMPEIQVYTCSICNAPFAPSDDSQTRRPSSGRSRFCSEPCRIAGRRLSNRSSWHRNKSKWRPRPLDETLPRRASST